MLIRELIERVTSIYHQGVRNYYTRLSNKRIYSIANSARTLLLIQIANKKQTISPFNYEILPCVPMEIIDTSSCPCEIPINCIILRSTIRLPKILTGINGLIIQNVTLTDGTLINSSSVNSVKYVQYNKYTGRNPYYFIHDNYLYIINLQHIRYVTVTAIFEDLLDKKIDFQCGANHNRCTYTPLNEKFTIDENLISTIVQMVVQEISVLQGNKDKEKKENQDNPQEHEQTNG
jgi:hypothetical protein